MARRQLAAFARSAELKDPEYEALRLLVSELVTNAVRHARAGNEQQIGLCLRSSDDTIRIEVSDHGRGFKLPRMIPRPRGDGGYGLFIVDRLCARWGVERNAMALVWCELDRRRRRRPATPAQRSALTQRFA